MKRAIAVAKALTRRRNDDHFQQERPEAALRIWDDVTRGVLSVLGIVTAMVVVWAGLCLLGAMLVGVEVGELIRNWLAAVSGR